MTLEFSNVYFSQQFFTYLESTDASLLEGLSSESMYDKAHYFVVQNKGYFILLGIMTVEWPKQLLD
jgi:hypothetical protein